MNTWTRDELDAIAGAAELDIAPRRARGELRRYTTIWVVAVGPDLFVRSYHGPNGSWYRSARRSGQGRIRAGGVERDVTFEDASGDRDAIDEAYRRKYGRSSYVDAMVTPDATATTLRLVPTDTRGAPTND